MKLSLFLLAKLFKDKDADARERMVKTKSVDSILYAFGEISTLNPYMFNAVTTTAPDDLSTIKVRTDPAIVVIKVVCSIL